jgi:hypothetical protein
VNLNQEVEQLTLQELRLLRNYPYAKQGLHFDDAEISAYFKTHTDWYESLAYQLWEKKKLPMNYSDITLPDEDRALVDKADRRIAELQQLNFEAENKPPIANINNLVNLFQFKDYDRDFIEKLYQNNFVITPGDKLQLFHLYEENDYFQIPNFITTDLYLQAFYLYFSYTLKSLEQQKFIPILSTLCLRLYNECVRIAQTESNPEIKALAEYNATFYAIPYYMLTGKELMIPEAHKKNFTVEISNINKQEDKVSKFMLYNDAKFPYSLFKAHGHYAQKPEMEAYFKAMMWLQTVPFCRDDEEQLKQAVFSAVLLNRGQSKEKESPISLYKAIYEPIAFLIGLPDNLSIMDITDYLKKEKMNNLQTVLKPQALKQINNKLAELAESRSVIKTKTKSGCPDKINFMPQRYLIDNDVIQNLVDSKPNSERAYPKGLDVFAAFGSEPASGLLDNFYKETEIWSEYPQEMQKMQKKFKNYKGWNYSVYNKWIESLLELQIRDKNHPGFMQTQAWDYKNLNTALASWAELKHDAILYGERPMTVDSRNKSFPASVLKGYVEPNLKFWNKLSETIVLTKNLLGKHKLLTSDLETKANQLSEYMDFLIRVSKKELDKKELSENEYRTIQYMGSSIEYFTLSIIDPDFHLDNWALVKGPDKSVAVVVDVYTRNIRNCNKSGILHVATGNANAIYVVVEMGGYLYLTRGATFSYYEFVEPMGIRLTDREWQKMIEEKKTPPVPAWMKDILVTKDPRVGERTLYSF